MYLSILILPFLGSLVSGFLGRKIGVTGAHWITCSCLILASLLSSIAFYEVGICGSPVTIHLFNWIESEFMSISWEFLFDQLTVAMFIPVLYISTLIHIYSIDYLSSDPHNQRFFSYLSLFTFFMLFLTAGANYFVMFVGWEGIGVVSYLLINFYFTRIQSNKAAILALTMNRVGDMGLSIGFFAMFALFGSLDYATIFSTASFMNENAITIISLLIFTGAMAKSAQLGLHSWLPGSMEAEIKTHFQQLKHFNVYFSLINLIFLLLILITIFILSDNFTFYSLNNVTETIIVIGKSVSKISNLKINIFNYLNKIRKMNYSTTNNRDSKGRFINLIKDKDLIPLPEAILNPLIGNLLGDGYLGFTHKDSMVNLNLLQMLIML